MSVEQRVRDALDRIAEVNWRLNAFYTVMADSALEAARQADRELARGKRRSPVQGMIIAVKDLFWTRGVKTTAGSKILADFVPRSDAEVVRRLRRGGAIIIGKTALHEFAYGITNDNPHFGPTRHPHDPARIPGGSSGGSGVAVAAGLCDAALGTDTGGSIRIPAALCGVVGLKPTFDAVSRQGVIELGRTLDHVGPLARTVDEAAAVFEVISGRKLPRVLRPIQGLRLGVPSNYFFDRLQPSVERAVRQALHRLARQGARLVEVVIPEASEATQAARTILLAEAARYHRRWRDRRSDYGADVRKLVETGEALDPGEVRSANRIRRRFHGVLREVWRRCDVLAMPTTPATATPIGQTTIAIGGVDEDVRLAMTRLVRVWNMAGTPALSVFCGNDRDRLPVGLQLVGPRRSEPLLVALGRLLEEEKPAGA
jgi:aspartyl-tRNA(Asn)/glutamyl-tRNA(Gln) amidotransferase subunit A